MLEWLSISEQQRLHSINHKVKRREYLLSRRLMRHALSEHFQRPEAQWQFVEQARAAPRLDNLPAATFLSLSHSGGYICFAIASCRVGVDIEIIKSARDYLASAAFFMDDNELAQLSRQQATCTDYFYRGWCTKEAWYKTLDATEQANTSMKSINYDAVRAGRAGQQLIEGDGGEFRLAAVVAQTPSQVEQHNFLAPITVSLEAD